MIALGVQRAGAIPPHPPLLVCEPLAGLICLPRGDDREPRREGRRFSSSAHEMRQPDAANRLERWSVGCGLFESRRRSLGAMGLGEPWVSHRAAAAETDQCGDRWGQGGGLLPACGYEQPRQTATHPNRTGPAPLVPAQPSRHVKGSDVMIQSERWVGGAWRRCVGSERQTPTEARQMKDFAGRIAVVTGGGSGMGRQLGDPDLSLGTESFQTRSLADGGTANTHKARSSDLGGFEPSIPDWSKASPQAVPARPRRLVDR